MPFLDTPDTVIAQLTLEGRNLLARCKLGDVVYRNLGWQVGRGGYEDDTTSSIAASQTITVGVQPNANDTLVIGGQVLTAKLALANGTTEFDIGATPTDTATNIASAINSNLTLSPYFVALAGGPTVTLTSRVKGGIGNFVTLDQTGLWAVFGGPTLVGGLGESGSNPVKVLPFVDPAVEADCVIEVIGNTFNAGDCIVINGVQFTWNVHWAAGPSIAATVQNIVASIMDSEDPALYRLVHAYVDGSNPNRFHVGSLVTGAIGNMFPVGFIDVAPDVNFLLVQQMSGGVSTFLEDPAYPVPPTLAPFVLPDGRLEQPSSTSVSFVCRIPEGPVGLQAYGEIGIWVELLQSNFSPELGTYTTTITTGTPAIFNSQSHGMVLDQPVTLTTTGALPTGLSTGTTYYVTNPGADTFSLAAIPAGPALAASGAQSGVHQVVTGNNRKVLFAHAHFPIQAKTDRSLYTFRIVVTF